MEEAKGMIRREGIRGVEKVRVVQGNEEWMAGRIGMSSTLFLCNVDGVEKKKNLLKEEKV